MSKDEKCTCKACKNTVFHPQICKFVGFLLPSSSWFRKLPNYFKSARSHVKGSLTTKTTVTKRLQICIFCNEKRSFAHFSRAFSLHCLFISQVFSSYPRLTCFSVAWTTRAPEQILSNFYFYPQAARSSLILG